jgi:hypothetical protein
VSLARHIFAFLEDLDKGCIKCEKGSGSEVSSGDLDGCLICWVSNKDESL